jgi:dephospho-CoA kinase
VTLTIGLTGGIASGKSTVAQMLAALGAVVVDADGLAREVVLPGTAALAEIAAEFGPRALTPSGELDRAAVASLVFSDPAKRRRLEEITHPPVAQLMASRLRDAQELGPPLVVADIPLLFEGGRQGGFDGVMLVYVPAAQQLERLLAREQCTLDEARLRLAAQLPIDEKRQLATWIVDNTGTLQETAAGVERWWRSVVGAAGRS